MKVKRVPVLGPYQDRYYEAVEEDECPYEIEEEDERESHNAHDMLEFPMAILDNRETWLEQNLPAITSDKNTLGELFSFPDGVKFTAEEIEQRIETSLKEDQDQELDEILDAMCSVSCAFFAQEVLRGGAEYGGKFFINEHHQQWDELIQQHDRLCVLAPRDHGKCGTGEELLVRADGRLVRLDQWAGGELVAWDGGKNELVVTHAPPVRENGLRPVLQIKLASGREITVTENHPFFSVSGWRNASELLQGDKIVVVKKFPEVGNQHVDDPWLRGLLLGDGRLQGTAILLTIFDQRVFEEVRSLVRYRGWNFRAIDNGLTWQIGIPNEEKAIQWARERDKRVPSYLFHAKVKYIKEFLAGYIDANGHFDMDAKGIDLYSSNIELIQELQHLFARIGVTTKQVPRPRRLRIDGACLRMLHEQVNLRSHKRHMLKTLADAQPEVDKSPVYFDTIESIESKGVRMTYALMVPETQTYVANDIVNHNTYFFDFAYPLWKSVTEPGSIGFIFSATAPQAERILDDIKEEIAQNQELRYLKPPASSRTNNNRWSARYIKLTNGSRIYARGFMTKVRGAHPNWIVIDDGLNDETIYSEVTRKKEIHYFKTAISNMVVPGGQIIVVGTPFHKEDLYGDLAENEEYHFQKYQAEDDEGNVLWPERYDSERLAAKKREIGSICYTREFRCDPIADDMSLFPKSLFRGPQVEKYNLVLGMPKEYWEHAGVTIYMGVDFALSSSVQADWTVVWVMGIDGFGNRWLIDIERHRGMPYQEQLSLINTVAQKYDPVLVYLEANQMQRIFGDELIRLSDLPIKQFTTGVEKHSLAKGVPSLRVLLENGKFRIPRGDKRSVELTEIWIGEMNSFTWADGKLQSVGGHDDTVMACWICDQAIRHGGFSFTFGDEDDLPSQTLDEILAEQMGEEPQQEQSKPEASLVDDSLLF